LLRKIVLTLRGKAFAVIAITANNHDAGTKFRRASGQSAAIATVTGEDIGLGGAINRFQAAFY
jgi:hypothetical protein